MASEPLPRASTTARRTLRSSFAQVAFGIVGALALRHAWSAAGAHWQLEPRANSVTAAVTAGLTTSTTVSSTASSETSTITDPAAVSTSAQGPADILKATLRPQSPLATVQSWCSSEIFCNGPLLQTINVAQLYGDAKTFVDKPTIGSPNATLEEFYALYNTSVVSDYSTVTYGSLKTFVEMNFQSEGLELEAGTLPSNTLPAFLQPNTTTIASPVILGWAKIVHSYWADLVRDTKTASLCDGIKCESTLIPLNHTFVIPGGRFREQYYWDSYWIIEGLIQSELYDLANSSLQNFMDELERYGFIPNGGRTYYLNRSGPPLFMKMLYTYVNATNDLSILNRALPLAEVELNWWYNNRTVNITSPYSNNTWELARYAVVNTAPRPEGFFEDYLTTNGPDISVPYTEEQKADLYAELASGAESGYDFTARFSSNPYVGGNSSNQYPILRTLQVRETIPVDLNSILYKYRVLLAELYTQAAQTATTPLSQAYHTQSAETLKSAILDIFWDSKKLYFYDFNITANARSSWFSPAGFYPYWSGIVPLEVAKDSTNALAAFSAVRMVLARYNGTFPGSFVQTGLQWDAPNAWPPHQFIIIEALQNLPDNLTAVALPTLSSEVSSFSLVPGSQLGLNESSLPPQPLLLGGNAPRTDSRADINEIDSLNGTSLVNGGDSVAGEAWNVVLAREVANRYMSAVFCSWYATGGSLPGLLPRLPDSVLNLTHSLNNTGNIFEKESMFDVDIAGSGGEYTVQSGFGWTNGIALWIAARFGSVLATPSCLGVNASSTTSTDAAIEFAAYHRALIRRHRRKSNLGHHGRISAQSIE
ncbi:glycoside hydrolase family 37 protein [Clavulina sp. PMI_390]|nr:glycoside hydrolase family 37 protein [Clavulina sp. PMI_390]